MPIPNPLGHAISRRLRKARDKRGLTVAELAKSAGTSPQTIHTLLNGEGHRSAVELLQSLAKALYVPAGWLAFGEDDEPDWT